MTISAIDVGQKNEAINKFEDLRQLGTFLFRGHVGPLIP